MPDLRGYADQFTTPLPGGMLGTTGAPAQPPGGFGHVSWSVGQPQFTVHSDGGMSIDIPLYSSLLGFIQDADLRPINHTGDRMLSGFVNQSRGMFTTGDLRFLGHPYRVGGTLQGGIPKGGTLPRHMSRSLSHVRGVHGSVGGLNVINLQSGDLLRAWKWELQPGREAVRMHFENDVLYASYLYTGTSKMIAHGPWQDVPHRFRDEVTAGWRNVQQAAAQRQQAAWERELSGMVF